MRAILAKGAVGPASYTAQRVNEAQTFAIVHVELEFLQNRRERKRLVKAASQERLTVDDYQALVAAGSASDEARATLEDEGLVYKAKSALGRQLLDDHHTKARDALDGALSSADVEGLRKRLEGHSPAEVADQVKKLIARVGLAQLSEDFAVHMVKIGRWASKDVLYQSTASERKTMNTAFNEYMRGRAAPGVNAVMPDIEALGRKVIEHALELLAITPREAAQAMARSVQVHKGGRAAAGKSALKGGGLATAINHALRFCGRALPRDARINFASHQEIRGRGRSNGRAFQSSVATGELDRSRKAMICVTGNMRESTVFHELGHAVDTVNPLANAMVAEWVRQRTEGKPAQTLRKLTGVKSFSSDERAVKDDFIDPYVGKLYDPYRGIKPNEALSMGLERLSDPRTAGMLALKDPDHLALVLAALQMEYQP
ncbi:hypothetical protein ACT3R7_12155 [Halomonas sp. AOP43-A1-21]